MDIIWTLVGCLISSVVTIILCNWRTAYGTLRIDHSNPEKDVYRIELGDLDKLKKKRRIELKIDHNANLSQD